MMTIKEAALRWGKSRSLISKWIAQGRLKITRPGNEILILSENPPAPAPKGSLSPAQRTAWPKGR